MEELGFGVVASGCCSGYMWRRTSTSKGRVIYHCPVERCTASWSMICDDTGENCLIDRYPHTHQPAQIHPPMIQMQHKKGKRGSPGRILRKTRYVRIQEWERANQRWSSRDYCRLSTDQWKCLSCGAVMALMTSPDGMTSWLLESSHLCITDDLKCYYDMNRYIITNKVYGNPTMTSSIGHNMNSKETQLVQSGTEEPPTNRTTNGQPTTTITAYVQPTLVQPTFVQPTGNGSTCVGGTCVQSSTNGNTYIHPTINENAYIQPITNGSAYVQPTTNQTLPPISTVLPVLRPVTTGVALVSDARNLNEYLHNSLYVYNHRIEADNVVVL